MKKLIVIIMSLFFLGSCGAQPKVDNSVSCDLQLEKYLGEWYEVARFDHRFERGMQFCKSPVHLA